MLTLILGWLILLGGLLYVLFPNIGSLKRPRTLAPRYIRAVHPYSGLDPIEWQKFKTNVTAFEDEEDVRVAARHLYEAIENIRNIGLSIRRSDDFEIQDALEGLAARLGIDGEYELYTSAQKKGFYFFPQYLNEIRSEDSNAAETDWKRGGTVGDPGTHFPDPKSHGQ